MWLKAFEDVEVDSTYTAGGQIRTRRFRFNVEKEVHPTAPVGEGSNPISTTVFLKGYRDAFFDGSHKTLDKIAFGLLEHLLWYFVRKEGVPRILVDDGGEGVELAQLFSEHMHAICSSENFDIGGRTFEVIHAKVKSLQRKQHTLAYCSAGRLVSEEGLTGKIPGMYGDLSDEDGRFTYVAYLTGDYLDERVTSDRLSFNISEDSADILVDVDISFARIREALLPLIGVFLGDCLTAVLELGRRKLNDFVSDRAPKYRPLLSHMSSETLSFDPSISERDLDMLLHRAAFTVEQEILEEGHELLTVPDDADFEEYAERLCAYLDKASDLKQSDLANYVAHRRVVIDLLEYSIRQRDDGTYRREETIHELIVPMRSTSDDLEFRRQNLWLLDERLAFHHFLASDLPMSANPTTQDGSGKEPDIAALRIFDNPMLFGDKTEVQAAITVVEIKRPMRTGFQEGEVESKDPILQGLGYLKRLRNNAKTVDGRVIPNADRIPGFVYVVADLTQSMIDCCRLHQLQRTSDGMGYFGYHRDDQYNAYIQVTSFSGVVEAAKQRNRAFFDTLGLPSA